MSYPPTLTNIHFLRTWKDKFEFRVPGRMPFPCWGMKAWENVALAPACSWPCTLPKLSSILHYAHGFPSLHIQTTHFPENTVH